MNIVSNHESGWGVRGTAGATIAGELVFEHVNFDVRAKAILRDINFRLAPGEIVSVLGPSGCGKTTLLRLAAGVSRPTQGRIVLDGEVVAGPTQFVPPEARSIGLVFQDFALFPHLTVLDNVRYGLHRWRREEADAAAERALARVGLANLVKAYPHQLSGGEQQRVALARAISPRPQILLMDEPFSGLDQRLREDVRGETLALLKEIRATVILVTHDPKEALEVSDRVMLMREGRIVQQASPREIYAAPADADAARFFAVSNEFEGRVSRGFVETQFGRFAARGLAEGEIALVLLRPELLGPTPKGLEALVKDSQYLGNMVRLTLVFPELEQEVFATVPAHLAPERGQITKFGLTSPNHEHGVLVFKKA